MYIFLELTFLSELRLYFPLSHLIVIIKSFWHLLQYCFYVFVLVFLHGSFPFLSNKIFSTPEEGTVTFLHISHDTKQSVTALKFSRNKHIHTHCFAIPSWVFGIELCTVWTFIKYYGNYHITSVLIVRVQRKPTFAAALLSFLTCVNACKNEQKNSHYVAVLYSLQMNKKFHS